METTSKDSPPGEGHITLDRTNLKRLAEVMAETPHGWDFERPDGFDLGWKAAIQAMGAMADRMPDLYGDDGYLVTR